MEFIRDRNKRESAIIVTIISILLLLLLLFTGLTYPDPPIDNSMSMEISFGRDNTGDGDTQPEETEAVESDEVPEEVTESNPTPVASEENVITQNTEETTTIPVEPNENVETTEIVEEPKQEVDPKALYPGNTSNSSANDSQGETGDPGDQGALDGADNTNYTGSHGTGSMFALSGRSILFVPKIVNNTQETGKVVVSIWVDRSGKVTRATPGARGSTTTSTRLYKIAKAAALKLKYSANSKVVGEQKSTITIVFKAGQ